MYKPMSNLKQYLTFLKESRAIRDGRVSFFERRSGTWSDISYPCKNESVKRRMQMERFKYVH